MRTIYIRLLEEGTEVLRPTEAEELEGGLLKVLPTPNYDPRNEHWEFGPGTVVRGIVREVEGDAVLVAVDLNHDKG